MSLSVMVNSLALVLVDWNLLFFLVNDLLPRLETHSVEIGVVKRIMIIC